MKILSLFLNFLAVVFSLSAAVAQTGRPNIILIIADDIGWDDLGCYGHTVVQSPVIDRMATEGIRFDNFYLTTSSCSPSRSSIISGRYPHNTGAAELHTPLPESISIFPELLQQAGYFTAQSGKWHMGEAARRGFDVIHDKEGIGDGGEEMWVPTLKDRPKDKPFFLWLAALDAHRPWGPNEFSGTHDPAQISPPVYLANASATKTDLAQYYDEIKRFDHYIGEVEKELQRQGVLENTLIMVISDNGRPFPRSKTRMYDSGIKSPFVAKWPAGIKKSASLSESMISSIDIAPTFLDLAEVKVPDSFQGKSFASLFEKPEKAFRKYVFAEHNWHDHEALERMVRTKDHLYVLNLRPSLSNNGPADSNASPSYEDLKDLRDKGRLSPAQADIFLHPRPYEELYLVTSDGEQLLNLGSHPGHMEALEQLREAMKIWIEDTKDTHPENLTPDWYDKETGKPLDTEKVRGEMPGGEAAMQTTAKGPF
ncbi:sulfatase family protein [Pleomorphovibrio marinus]|uniref:sulfatase family protein n=1 Tax=Pleomorphovibrio marinus TaxID=2164132 RepID=UPI000E0ADC37|nr:sulfatase [Pleomorphovibrio marinus]